MASESTTLVKRLRPRSTAYRYLFAVVAPAATMCLAFLLYTYISHNPVLWGLLAIMIVAWHVGFGPGIVAALVVIAVSRLLFQPNAPLLPSAAELMRLGLFLAMIPAGAAPEDEDALLRQLVDERRVVIRLKVNRLYGTALDIEG